MSATKSEEKSLFERVKAGEFASPVYPSHAMCRTGVEYAEKLRDYRTAERATIERFKLACFKEYDIESNPKRDRLWTKCWEMGHAAGLHEVMSYISDLVELIK